MLSEERFEAYLRSPADVEALLVDLEEDLFL
jgi:hypothetical protein